MKKDIFKRLLTALLCCGMLITPVVTQAEQSVYEAEYEEEYEGEAENFDLFPATLDDLLTASIGDRLYIMMNDAYTGWFKFDEDDQRVYLLYDGYYPADKLYFGYTAQMVAETGMEAHGNYGLVWADYYVRNGKDHYLTNEHYWGTIAEAVKAQFPQHDVKVLGAPTYGQVERAMEKYPDVAYIGSTMLNPFISRIDRCDGWWVTHDLNHLGAMNYYDVEDGLKDIDGWSMRQNAVRPFITLYKAESELSPLERMDKAVEIANRRDGEYIIAGEHILHYGKYTLETDAGAESYTLTNDGRFVYEFNGETSAGSYAFGGYEAEYGQWDGTLELECYFDDHMKDFLLITSDDALDKWTKEQYVFVGAE